jgi:hypothetical protein
VFAKLRDKGAQSLPGRTGMVHIWQWAGGA